MSLPPAENKLYDDYEAHLKVCEVCAEQYSLQEDGDIEFCCLDGIDLIKKIHENFFRRFNFTP